ncbi:MAG: head GIN domain-containing protein [Pyrinomonadaceae bacterium]
MNKIAIAIALSLGMLATGCNVMKRMSGQVVGSGNIKTEKREVVAFTGVSSSGAFNVNIVCQKDRSVSIEGDDNLLPLITTEVKDGTLYIDSEKGFSTKKPIVIHITTPDINELKSSGAGEFTVSNLKNDDMRFDTSGAATIKASGETKTLKIKMSGAGSVEAGNLKARDVNIKMSGAGSADVYASNQLDADISGAGSVTYSGDPATVNKQVSGIGSIAKK